MINKEKVIKAWEIFRDSNPYQICDGREFRAIREPEYCMGQMIEDTIALLKTQEPVEPIQDMVGDALFWVCGKCGHDIRRSDWYCANCGRAAKWE